MKHFIVLLVAGALIVGAAPRFGENDRNQEIVCSDKGAPAIIIGEELDDDEITAPSLLHFQPRRPYPAFFIICCACRLFTEEVSTKQDLKTYKLKQTFLI